MIATNLVTPKAAAKQELLFNKLSHGVYFQQIGEKLRPIFGKKIPKQLPSQKRQKGHICAQF
jgi:hypothetical protein